MKKSRRKIAAFTLVEVVFSVFVIAMCALVVASTMPVATMSRTKADQLTRASDIAEKEMECIRGAGFVNATPSQMASEGLIDSSTPISTNTYSFTNVDNGLFDNPATVLPSGTGTVQLTTLSLGTVQVVVTVNYVSNGVNKTITTGTVLANL